MGSEQKDIRIAIDDKDLIRGCKDHIESTLKGMGVQESDIVETQIVAEEMIVLLMENAGENSSILVKIRRFMGETSVVIESAGNELNISDELSIAPEDYLNMDEDEADYALRSILLKSLGEKFKYNYKHGKSYVRITVGHNEKKLLYRTVIAMGLGLIMGLLMQTILPHTLSEGLSTFVLSPIKTIFMNALKIIIAPVVFFSLTSCIVQFKDLSALGRIGAKVMGMYLLTTVIAVGMAAALAFLIHPGEFGFALTSGVEMAETEVDTNVDTSIMHILINVVPSNFISPFLESDTLQIIFLAILCGVAVGMIGQYATILQEFFEACNALFLTITTLITKIIPLAVFCSVSLMISETGFQSLGAVGGAVLNQLAAVACMLTIYAILILVLAKLNPFTFYKKNWNGMLTSFSLCSSSAAMPTNLNTCIEKLGISPKVCNFSIPLGATVNMDGTCIFLAVNALFLARAYGVTVTPSVLVSFMITIVLLSLGAPGVPGSAFVCIGVVLEILGVPLEAMGLIMGVAPILDMFDTMSNCTGDVTTALIVAKSENLLDIEKYNEKV